MGEQKTYIKKGQDSKSTTTTRTLKQMTTLPVGESFWVECGKCDAQNFIKRWNENNPKSKLKVSQRKRIAIDPVSLKTTTLFYLTILNRNDEE